MNKQVLEEGKQLNLQFDKRGGLIPVIVQNSESKEILMLGYANRQAFEKTVSSGMATFWSTSRKQIWTKGETSGDYLLVDKILVDCDQDSIIYQVTMQGSGACHTKNNRGNTRKSCFYREYQGSKDSLENIDP
ncbi:phosphoribosyl-AMP cyclohydrolase [Catalinimonas alkaloidigena]|uniref:phosphoribosyl-AMP cyclohydrolase n=1 Tax=Catalinimonas alkaloidigena TaxID=1075417 RepID=UPI002404DE81|nr:phosphoribosyl-AMP cyclohydrolase [Catalinimonas alkaloidigena]MDF9797687.1 phosphoribosyl-AMP cyclohydrolase [Catalinimonas alkaloidigena]